MELEFVAEFGTLVRYAYYECSAGDGILRRLIVQFAACVLEDVKSLNGWRELVMELLDFGMDLLDARCGLPSII